MAKECTRCKKYKLDEEFGTVKWKSIDGRNTRCKSCINEAQREGQSKAKPQNNFSRPKLDNALCMQFLGVKSSTRGNAYYVS